MNKCKTMTLVAASLIAIMSQGTISCSSQDDNVPTQETQNQRELTFEVLNYKQTIIDDEPLTRSASVTALDHLVMIIYSSDGKLVKTVSQNKGSNGYGSFTLDLEYDTYEIAFIGYDGTHEIAINGLDNISFADNYVPNTFLKYLTLVVDANTTSTQSISLARCVGCLNFEFTDQVPSSVNTIQIALTGAGTTFSARTGQAVNTSRVVSGNISSWVGKTNQSVNLMVFLPTSPCTITANVSVKNVSDKVLYQHSFTEVPMAWNQKTTYTGQFFTHDALSASLELESTDWIDKAMTF